MKLQSQVGNNSRICADAAKDEINRYPLRADTHKTTLHKKKSRGRVKGEKVTGIAILIYNACKFRLEPLKVNQSGL